MSFNKVTVKIWINSTDKLNWKINIVSIFSFDAKRLQLANRNTHSAYAFA